MVTRPPLTSVRGGNRPPLWVWLGFWVACVAGCGTTRMTDTQRTATEQLLVSNAIDQAVSELDFRPLKGKTVFFDPQYLDGVVDRGYLVSSLRQHLLANGCLLQEDRARASFVVEVRSGGVGTNRHGLLIGVPQMSVPSLVPGQPSQIPEIPLAKKTDQEGIAKIAVFAYNRLTGQPLWQSGVVQAASTAKDTWFLGAGPFQQGTIRKGTEFAGEPLPLPHFGSKEVGPVTAVVPVTSTALWPDVFVGPPEAKPLARPSGSDGSDRPNIGPLNRIVLAALAGGTDTGGPAVAAPGEGGPPMSDRPSGDSGKAAGKANSTPPSAPSQGGKVETEPNSVFVSGASSRPEPRPANKSNRTTDWFGLKSDK